MKPDKTNPTENTAATLEEAVRGAVMRLLTKRMKELSYDDLTRIEEKITEIEKAKYA